MAALKALEDWAFFEVWQDDNLKIIRFKRISGPGDVRIAGHSTTYLDANQLEAMADKYPTKIKRSPIPADWALKQTITQAEFDAFVHKHDYAVSFV